MSEIIKIKPLNFVKWAGGKKQILPVISEILPETIVNLLLGVELFFSIFYKSINRKMYIYLTLILD